MATSDFGKVRELEQFHVELGKRIKEYVKANYAKPMKHLVQINKLLANINNSKGVKDKATHCLKFDDYVTNTLKYPLDEQSGKSNRKIERFFNK